MKKLMLFGIAIIFVMSIVAAATFDNIKSYDKDTNTITVKNWFNVGETLITAKLNSNTDVCGSSCSAEKEITLFSSGTLVNDVRFYDVTGGKEELSSIKNYQLSYWGDVPSYQYQCIDVKTFGNGTIDQDCSRVQSGTEKGWVKFVEGQVFPLGTYNVRLTGQKNPYKSYDWQVNLKGRWTTEWAIWGSIGGGDEAEVILNSPADGKTSFTSNNITFNASANVTGGDTIQNMSLYTNTSGSWAKNQTIAITTNVGELWVSGFADGAGSATIFVQGIKFTAVNDTFLINGTKHASATDETVCALYYHGNLTNIQNATYSGDVCTFSPKVEIDNGQTYVLGSHAGATSRGQTRDTSPGFPILSSRGTINGTTGWTSNVGDDPTGYYITDMGFEVATAPIFKEQIFFANVLFGTTLWNVEGCDNQGNCSFAPANFTFDISFIEIGKNFNSTTFETTRETFYSNISTNGSTITSPTFTYNGSTYTATATNVAGDFWNLSHSLDVNKTNGNKTFFFNFTLGGIAQGTPVSQQTVNLLNWTFCEAGATNFANFTFKNETLSAERVNAAIDFDWYYWLGGRNQVKFFEFTNASENDQYLFCLIGAENETIQTNYSVAYSNSISSQRNSFDTTNFTNSTTNITLLLLPTSEGIFVTFQIVNPSEQTIPGANVNVTRGGNLIGSGITDSAGLFTIFLDPDLTYTIGVSATGFSSLIVNIQPTQSSFTLTLGQQATSVQQDLTKGVTWTINPINQILMNNTDYTFNFTISSVFWGLDSWGFKMKNSTGNVFNTTTSTVSTGGILNIVLNTNFSVNNLIMEAFWLIDSTNYTNVSRSWQIFDDTDRGFSIKRFFDDLSIYVTAGIFGINAFALGLIVFAIIFTTVGFVSFKWGLTSPAAISSVLFVLVAFFDVVLGLIPNPTNAIPNFATVVIGIILVGVLFREGLIAT